MLTWDVDMRCWLKFKSTSNVDLSVFCSSSIIYYIREPEKQDHAQELDEVSFLGQLDCVSPPHDHPIPHAIILSSRFLSNADGHMQEENIDADEHIQEEKY